MLEKLMSVSEFENLTADEMLIHLFADTADTTMSRIALDILSAGNPTVAELRTKVTETENAIWYNKNVQTAKLAGLQGGGKHCTTCQGRSHNTEDCWEFCKYIYI